MVFFNATAAFVIAKNYDRPYRPLTTKVGGQTRLSWAHGRIWPLSSARGMQSSNFIFVSFTVPLST